LAREYLRPAPAPSAITVAMAKAAERRAKGLPVYNFASGNVGMLPLNLGLFACLKLAVREGLEEGLSLLASAVAEGVKEALVEKPIGLAYSPVGGTSDVKALVLRYFKEVHGLSLKEDALDHVIATAGGQMALAASLRALRPGTKLLMRRWEYEPASAIARNSGLVEVRLPLEEDLSLDLSALEGRVPRGSVFYVSMPNNPTGFTSPEELRRICELMAEHGGGVIWDAPYIFTILKLARGKATFDQGFLDRVLDAFRAVGREHHEVMCILSSLSKTCLIAGLRFGMACACPEWVSNMQAILARECLSSPTPSFIVAKAVLNAFLAKPITHVWTCRVLAERLTVLMEEVGDHLILPGNGTFGALYVLLRTPEDGARFAAKLLEEHGVVVVPGEGFYGGPVSAVRLSLVATPWTEGDEEWLSAVKALRKALGGGS